MQACTGVSDAAQPRISDAEVLERIRQRMRVTFQAVQLQGLLQVFDRRRQLAQAQMRHAKNLERTTA